MGEEYQVRKSNRVVRAKANGSRFQPSSLETHRRRGISSQSLATPVESPPFSTIPALQPGELDLLNELNLRVDSVGRIGQRTSYY